mmetsp:Transcript_593/g.984  ORF Transcript_593/g.984 Transcript_593/m.984 type:complete len:703 (+) Transcript_593:129-2237(+)
MSSIPDRKSICVQPLTVSQRMLRGVVCATLESCTAVLEGLIIYHYNDKKNVSLQYLGLANFVVGVLTVYLSIVVGNMSDRSKGKYRRKPFIFVFAPIYAIGVFLRYGAFASEDNAALYYAITLIIQVAGRSGLSIAHDAWNIELANEEVDRGNLYSTVTAMGVLGILIGLGLTAIPLVVDGVILSLSLIVWNAANLCFIPEGTPLIKRCFIPTVTNISSVLWNTQYCIYLGAMTCLWFVNSIPGLLLFFLRFCVGQNDNGAAMSYTFCVGGFIFVGFLALPCIPKLISARGKIFVSNMALGGLVVLGVIFFGVSYTNPYAVIAVFSIVGFFATMSNTIFNILAADCVDYDELLTGMKRASSYTGFTNLPFMFINVAGTSLPLALMSVLGFEQPEDDDEDDHNDDGHSTVGSTYVLRVWCSLFVSFVAICAFLIMRFYKIDNVIHTKILENISKRESDRVLDEENFTPPRSGSFVFWKPEEFTESPLNNKLVDDDVPVEPEPLGIKLEATQDPITDKLISPPPYVTTLHTVNSVINNWKVPIGSQDQSDIRFLGYYFPTMLKICGDENGRHMLYLLAIWKYFLFFSLLALGTWQSVVVLIDGNEFGSYLMVVMTTIYSIYFVWEILYVKGYITLSRLSKSEKNLEIGKILVSIGEKIEVEKETSGLHVAKYATSMETYLSDTILTSFLLIGSFVGCFLALNLT